jgi:UDP-N-acetylmuramoylalanine--D-glutamate ligase
MTDVRGKRVLVVGLARSGRAAAVCLRRHGAVVTVTDLRPPAEFQHDIPELIKEKIGMVLGAHRPETFLRQDLIVLSPGVYPEPPPLRAARQQHIPVFPEIEAASWFLEGCLLGVTGTNGKTTTAALLGKILQSSGFPTFVGGNIGTPLSLAVDQVSPQSMVVSELSSFQLEVIQEFRPRVAVLLNLAPNHLDRHPDFDSYVRAKAQIFRNQKATDYAILNADDPTVMSLAPAIPSRKVFFSRLRDLPDGLFVSNGHIKYRVGNLERVLLERSDVRLRGDFNLENVLAAAAAACVVGADFAAMRQAVRDFQGVEHRLELVREVRGVEFYNNSKATSVAATVSSLEAFERGVHLILGGKDKGAPYEPIRRKLQDRVRYVYVIGAAAGRIAKELAGAVELIQAGNLETAVREAFERAAPGEVVLLAPACSSFDQFRDYEERGRVFKELVQQLPKEVAAGFSPATCPALAAEAEQAITPLVGEPSGLPKEAPAEAATAIAAETEPASAALAGEPSGLPKEVPAEVRTATEPPEGAAEPQRVPEEPRVATSTPAPPELIYVYEVAAEEVEPLETQVAQDLPGDNIPVIPVEELRVVERLEDEPLPYESRAAPPGAADGPTLAPGMDGKEKSSPGGPGGQPRLPGM